MYLPNEMVTTPCFSPYCTMNPIPFQNTPLPYPTPFAAPEAMSKVPEMPVAVKEEAQVFKTREDAVGVKLEASSIVSRKRNHSSENCNDSETVLNPSIELWRNRLDILAALSKQELESIRHKEKDCPFLPNDKREERAVTMKL